MRFITLLVLIFSLSFLSAQDTLRVMQYNLLYYGENTGFCNFTNNSPDQKDAWLRTIIEYAKPDIFTVNEISRQSTYQTRVLQQVMNQTGYALFKMAASPNIAESNIVNQLFYNSEKLALQSQEVAQSEVRDIDVYRLYCLNEGLLTGDTIFIHCIVGHLKAGSSSSDKIDRKEMTQNTLTYLGNYGRPGNYLFMGDFNLYDSDEPAFQLMITNNDPVFRFYDPVDQIGDWHENAAYRQVHTQSTHIDSDGCHSSGGMDDRFDFILMNEVLQNKGDKVYYAENSYHAMGQDGIRLNHSLLDPPNASLPAYVIDALYNMSDHLPVVMGLVVNESLGLAEDHQAPGLKAFFRNPADDMLTMYVQSEKETRAIISLVSLSGSRVYLGNTRIHQSDIINIPLNGLAPGMYFVHIQTASGNLTRKVIKR